MMHVENIFDVIGDGTGILLTFTGRRVYSVRVDCTLDDGDPLAYILRPAEYFGAYPSSHEANKIYAKWCAANSSDPVVDEVLADRYLVHVLTPLRTYSGDVYPVHRIEKNNNECFLFFNPPGIPVG